MLLQIEINMIGGAFFRGETIRRSFEMAPSTTLQELCGALLMSLHFDRDHLYGFQIGNQSYEGSFFDGGSDNQAAKTKLYQLNLKRGDCFSLLYDYGDSWEFNLRVLDVLDAKGGAPKLIDAHGIIEQYPNEDWDDDEYDADDDDMFDEEGSGDDLFFASWTYRPDEKLFDAAFLYKKTKLWKKIGSSEWFAVRYSDQETGIISVMGRQGDHCALGIYIGDEAYRSLVTISHEPPDRLPEYIEYLHSQRCLQLVFDNQEYLQEMEKWCARVYAEEHGIRLAGKNAFPHFTRHEPGFVMWHPLNEKEEQYLYETAMAAVYLSETLKDKRPKETGLKAFGPDVSEIPLIVYDEKGCREGGKYRLPEISEPVYPAPEKLNELLLRKVRKIKKQGTLECALVLFDEPYMNAEDEIPRYPWLLMMADAESGTLLRGSKIVDTNTKPEEIADDFLQTLCDYKKHPQQVIFADRRTEALLGGTVSSIGSKPQFETMLPIVDDAYENLIRRKVDEDDEDDEADFASEMKVILAGLDMILALPQHELRTMPSELKNNIREMIRNGLIPEEKAAKLKAKLHL